MNMNFGWPPEMVDRLKSLVATDTLSASEIAIQLGHNLNRNAVIGKCRRLGLQIHRRISKSVLVSMSAKPDTLKPIDPKPPLAFKKPIRDVVLNRAPETECMLSEVTAFTCLADLKSHQCRYPYGDRYPFKYCAEPTLDESSYCSHHFLLCHVSARKKTTKRSTALEDAVLA